MTTYLQKAEKWLEGRDNYREPHLAVTHFASFLDSEASQEPTTQEKPVACEHPSGTVMLHAVCDTCGNCQTPPVISSYTPKPQPLVPVEWQESEYDDEKKHSDMKLNDNIVSIGKLLERLLTKAS